MNECEKYELLIGCLIDGEISEEDRKVLEEHLEQCPSCKALYETYASVFATDDLPEPPSELASGVMEKIAMMPDRKKKPAIRIIRYFSAAAIVALAVYLSMPLFGGVKQQANSTEPQTAQDTSGVPEISQYNEKGFSDQDSAARTESYEFLKGKSCAYIYTVLPDYITSQPSYSLDDGSLVIFPTEGELSLLIKNGYFSSYEGLTTEDLTTSNTAIIFVP